MVPNHAPLVASNDWTNRRSDLCPDLPDVDTSHRRDNVAQQFLSHRITFLFMDLSRNSQTMLSDYYYSFELLPSGYCGWPNQFRVSIEAKYLHIRPITILLLIPPRVLSFGRSTTRERERGNSNQNSSVSFRGT